MSEHGAPAAAFTPPGAPLKQSPGLFLYADSLAVPINISTGDAAVVLRWEPSPRAACPGALAKYLICHVAEGDNVTCEWDPPDPRGGQEEGDAHRKLPDCPIFGFFCLHRQ